MSNKIFNKTIPYIYALCKLHKAIKIIESKTEHNKLDKDYLETFYRNLNFNLDKIKTIISGVPFENFKQFINNKKLFFLSAAVNPPKDMIESVKKERAHIKAMTDVNFSFSSSFDYLMLNEKNPEYKQIAKNYANTNLEKFEIFEKHYLPSFEKTPTNKANNLITKK